MQWHASKSAIRYLLLFHIQGTDENGDKRKIEDLCRFALINGSNEL
jgi:hypothetical protein